MDSAYDDAESRQERGALLTTLKILGQILFCYENKRNVVLDFALRIPAQPAGTATAASGVRCCRHLDRAHKLGTEVYMIDFLDRFDEPIHQLRTTVKQHQNSLRLTALPSRLPIASDSCPASDGDATASSPR